MWTSSLASNMNFPASLAICGFLAASGGLVLAALAIVTALFVRKERVASGVAKLAALGTAFYAILLFGFSLASREQVLCHGQEKYFCEVDCHLAYSVVSVKADPEQDSVRYTLVLRTRFDENTISPGRPKNASVVPNPRQLRVVDNLVREYSIMRTAGTPLTTSLVPGQSYTTEYQFKAPRSATKLRLLIASRGWAEHLVIGDEQSPWHKKTWLGL